MDTYIAKKRNEIKAAQFNPPHEVPKGILRIIEGEGGVYGYVRTIQGQEVKVSPGEYVVEEKGDPTRHYPIQKEYFEEHYAKI